ncbi:hypothetical protein [Aidingimonas lacisalsi]|uniref:hypothetical protein n=1 Tax=Aidingimonas lacisalsi TaxID=2604086 RepID=UPI0011D28039|nr:hypothetical protein [Aidingimonas lacisalsi]
MKKKNEPPKVKYTKRWFCYLDLLGFRRLVETNSIQRILPIYEKALKHLEDSALEYNHRGLYSSWFSDTFLLYSASDSAKHFALLEHLSRTFFQNLILNEIPVRGAISCGDLYSQQERNIFIGPALIDAYTYGEGQDWIGLLLTPSTLQSMREIGFHPEERAMYRKVEDPKVLKSDVEGPVYAYAFNNGSVNGQNPYKRALNKMKSDSSSTQSKKYDKTLSFLSRGALS